MGRHASADRRRRLAAWPVVVAVAVLVLAGLTVGYFVIVNSAKTTSACTGNTVLAVTASPGAERAVGDAAAAFNATHPVARSTCVSVAVTVMSGAAAAGALADNWTGQSSAAPGLWVVDSAADVASLDASNSAMTAGHSNSNLATSPVVLAVRSATAGPVSWATLAAGPGSGTVLAIPEPVGNRASGYALESLAAAGARTPPGKAVDAAAVNTVTPLFARLTAAVPAPPATTQAALTALAAGAGNFNAVPVVESDLAAFNAAHSTHLSAAYPTGPTAGDELLAVPLTASWVTAAVSDAAAAFDAFLGDPKGTTIITADYVRTAAPPPTAVGVDLAKSVTALPDAGAGIRTSLQRAWASAGTSSPAPTTPVVTTSVTSTAASITKSTDTTSTSTAGPAGPAVTLVLDHSASMSTVEGNQQRLTWVQKAVNAGIGDSAADLFGLWSFSTGEGTAGYTKVVPLGRLSDAVGGQTRAVAITNAVNGLTPGGDTWTYGTIRAVYGDAISSAVAGRANRVIVLTDGADSTPGLTRAATVATVTALAAQNPSVVLDIIGLSSDVNSAAMTEIAHAGRGTFTALSAISDLQSTLATLLAG